MEPIVLNCPDLETEFKDLYGKIRIYGTVENPYFIASDVADALGVDLRYRGSDTPFNETHKTKITITTGEHKKRQEVIAFTESGLTLALFRSKAQVAVRYQDLVYRVMKTLRLKGVVTLKESIAEMKQKYEATALMYYNRMNDAVKKADAASVEIEDYKDKYLDLKIKYDQKSMLSKIAAKQLPKIYMQAYEEDGKTTTSIDCLDTSVEFKFKTTIGDWGYGLFVLSVRHDISTLETHLKNKGCFNKKGLYEASVLDIKHLIKTLIFEPFLA